MLQYYISHAFRTVMPWSPAASRTMPGRTPPRGARGGVTWRRAAQLSLQPGTALAARWDSDGSGRPGGLGWRYSGRDRRAGWSDVRHARLCRLPSAFTNRPGWSPAQTCRRQLPSLRPQGAQLRPPGRRSPNADRQIELACPPLPTSHQEQLRTAASRDGRPPLCRHSSSR